MDDLESDAGLHGAVTAAATGGVKCSGHQERPAPRDFQDGRAGALLEIAVGDRSPQADAREGSIRRTLFERVKKHGAVLNRIGNGTDQ